MNCTNLKHVAKLRQHVYGLKIGFTLSKKSGIGESGRTYHIAGIFCKDFNGAVLVYNLEQNRQFPCCQPFSYILCACTLAETVLLYQYLLRKNEPALQIVVASLLPMRDIHRAEICILFGTMHSLCCHHRILVLGVMFFFAASCSGTPIKYNRLKCNLPLHTCPYRTAPTDLLRLRLTAQEAAGILYLFPKL